MARTHQALPHEKTSLPVLPGGSFVDNFDDLDLKALTEEDETARTLGS
jgi:hypothetical protein